MGSTSHQTTHVWPTNSPTSINTQNQTQSPFGHIVGKPTLTQHTQHLYSPALSTHPSATPSPPTPGARHTHSGEGGEPRDQNTFPQALKQGSAGEVCEKFLFYSPPGSRVPWVRFPSGEAGQGALSRRTVRGENCAQFHITSKHRDTGVSSHCAGQRWPKFNCACADFSSRS
ncbi:hypothetical protein E2C01_026370 [Portunus trituberculatus]|uniref:Uncharacterized protein n=1 Tax=Portunus trituberculatus TaxID=210409 RepID=A0A5B7EFT4_PORTR|nr:hypothetical protein [Portunus trituberculatus]